MPLFSKASESSCRKMPRIVFVTGVDGSGKSFITQKLIAELKQKGLPVQHIWSRFNNIISKPLLAFCRLAGLNYYEKKNGVLIGYHDFERSRIISWCFVLCQIIDIWIVSVFKIWPRIVKGNILVCDRGAYDTLVDVMIDTKNRSLCRYVVAKMFLLLLPRNHKVFLLTRDAALIFKDRPDVSIDKNFQLRHELYMGCAERFGWMTVNNNGTPDDTLQTLLMGLFSK